MMKSPELLVPAGDPDKLKTALLYGADAVYAGTPDLSLRTKSGFTVETLKKAIEDVHAKGKKIHLNLNLTLRNGDIEKLPSFLNVLKAVEPDAAIVSDPGVFDFLREEAPDLPIHVSTQANVCSWLTVKSWQKRGAERVILAREVPFKDIEIIREKCPDVEIETFAHGAMCVSHSGRCLISAFMTGRSGNRGDCAHSCRWHYTAKIRLKDGKTEEITITDQNRDLFNFLLEEDFRPGDFLEMDEDDHGAYLMNARDLCWMPVLKDVVSAGIDSLKIEGRNKSPYYVAIATRAYRHALDALAQDPVNFDPLPYMKELYTLQSRGYSLGFFNGEITHLSQDYETTLPVGRWQYAARIIEQTEDAFMLDVKCSLKPGDVVEFLPPGRFEPVRLRMYEFEDARNGNQLEAASANKPEKVRVPFSLFDKEDLATLAELLPVGTIARTQTHLPPDKEKALNHKIETFAQETGLSTKELQKRLREKADAAEALNPPAWSEDDCCGQGCNNCRKRS